MNIFILIFMNDSCDIFVRKSNSSTCKCDCSRHVRRCMFLSVGILNNIANHISIDLKLCTTLYSLQIDFKHIGAYFLLCLFWSYERNL